MVPFPSLRVTLDVPSWLLSTLFTQTLWLQEKRRISWASRYIDDYLLGEEKGGGRGTQGTGLLGCTVRDGQEVGVHIKVTKLWMDVTKATYRRASLPQPCGSQLPLLVSFPTGGTSSACCCACSVSSGFQLPSALGRPSHWWVSSPLLWFAKAPLWVQHSLKQLLFIKPVYSKAFRQCYKRWFKTLVRGYW